MVGSGTRQGTGRGLCRMRLWVDSRRGRTQQPASADPIDLFSGEFASGVSDLSARTERQAGSLHATHHSLSELTAFVRRNADRAREAHRLAEGASSVAQAGDRVGSRPRGRTGPWLRGGGERSALVGAALGRSVQADQLVLSTASHARPARPSPLLSSRPSSVELSAIRRVDTAKFRGDSKLKPGD